MLLRCMARIEKLKPVLSQVPEIVHRIDRLSGLIVQPSAAPDSVAIVPHRWAQICGPHALQIQITDGSKVAIDGSAGTGRLKLSQYDKLKTQPKSWSIWPFLKRWYYRSNRIGEIFFADDKDTLPMRKIVRGISRVYRGEKLQPEPESLQSSVNIYAAGYSIKQSLSNAKILRVK